MNELENIIQKRDEEAKNITQKYEEEIQEKNNPMNEVKEKFANLPKAYEQSCRMLDKYNDMLNLVNYKKYQLEMTNAEVKRIEGKLKAQSEDTSKTSKTSALSNDTNEKTKERGATGKSARGKGYLDWAGSFFKNA